MGRSHRRTGGDVSFTAVILGVTQAKAGSGMVAGLAIGLTLVVIHIVHSGHGSPNPARSPGLRSSSAARRWRRSDVPIVPLIGGVIAGWTFKAKVLSAD